MGAVMAISAGAQGATGFAGSMAQASATRAQGEYQQSISNTNARLANFQAQDAIDRGNLDADRHETQVKGMIGSQRAALAAQGIDVNSGSAADAQGSTAAMGAVDAATIRNNAWRESFGYKMNAINDEAQGAMSKAGADFSANQTMLTGGMNALGSFAKGGYYGKEAGWFDKKGKG